MLPEILLSMMVAVSQVNGNCEMNKCTGPYELRNPPVLNPALPVKEMKTVVMMFPETIPAWVMTRWVYTAYCYTGPSWDKRTGCTEETKPLPPSYSESIDWVSKQACLIGPVCKLKGKCWGNDAELCKTYKMKNWVENKEFDFAGEHYGYYAYHTCNMDWSCNILRTEFPHAVKYKDGSVTTAIYLPNGTSWAIPHDRPYLRMKESSIQLGEAKGTLHPGIGVSCVNRSVLLCQVTSDAGTGLQNKVFEHVGNGVMVHANAYFKLSDQKENGLFGNDHVRISEREGAASSINDVISLIDEVELTTGLLYHNNMVVQQEISKLVDMFHKLVGSLSKIDDELLGTLLSVPSKTVWETRKVFKMCPCETGMKMEYSNCDKDSIFSSGRVVRKNESTSSCVSFPEGTVKGISLVQLQKLQTVELSPDTVLGTSENYEGWSWVAANKRQIIDSITLSRSSGEPGEPLGNVLSVPSSLFTFGMFTTPFLVCWNVCITLCLAMLCFRGK